MFVKLVAVINNLYRLYKWSKNNNVQFSCTNDDIKQQCIEAAQKIIQLKMQEMDRTGIIKPLNLKQKLRYNVIFKLVLPSFFNEDELLYQLQWIQQNSMVGFYK